MAKAESDLRSMLSNGMDPHQLPWYEPDLEEVSEPSKTILEKYSKLPSEEVIHHVKSLRDRAFKVFPYPCIGSFRFLDMSIPQSPVYPEVLQRLKSGEKLLDLGCAIGQELRHLVWDGVPSKNLYASDLRHDFFDMGYDLFKDRNTLDSTFIEADIFDDTSALVQTITDKVDIVNAASFFHLFNWSHQITIAKRVGRVDPPDPDERKDAPEHYRHDVASWKTFWECVGRETGTRWDVDAWMENWEGADRVMKNYHGGLETYKLRFVVRRA